MTGFWNAQTSEPLRQYRWVIYFGNTTTEGLDVIKYALKKVDKPKAKVEEITHKYLNHFFYYPGRLSWEPINITFAAVTQPNATYLFDKVLKNAGYKVPTGDTGQARDRETVGKRKFNSAIGSFDIAQLNPNGDVIEKWTITNPFFTSVQFGTLDYSSEEIVEIQCTVRYDYAQLTQGSANIANDSLTTVS